MDRSLPLVAAQYRLLCERLRAVEPDLDNHVVADRISELTNLHDMVAAVVEAALNDEALAQGLRGRMATIQQRLARLETRAQKHRRIARDVMVDCDLRRIDAPEFTLSIRRGSPSLVVLDESAIPAEFFEARAPCLNRQALLAQLKQGGCVPGAQLSNPEPVLNVRGQ